MKVGAEAAETHMHPRTCQTHRCLDLDHRTVGAGAGATAEVVQEAEVEGVDFSDCAGEGRQRAEEEEAQVSGLDRLQGKERTSSARSCLLFLSSSSSS